MNSYVILFHVELQYGTKMCTGYFNGGANSPLTGTGCVYPCVYATGEWGSSWCYTKLDRSEWGAECIHCSGKGYKGLFLQPLEFIKCS